MIAVKGQTLGTIFSSVAFVVLVLTGIQEIRKKKNSAKRAAWREWLADYEVAVAQDRDQHGRDPFDLLAERWHGARMQFVFSADFTDEGQRRSVEAAFRSMGYDVSWRLPHDGLWLLRATRLVDISSAATVREEVSHARASILANKGRDADWQFHLVDEPPGGGRKS